VVTPIETFIIAAREVGVHLVLLWLLTLAVVWGLLQHANVPKSVSARGVIAISAAFLVLLAAAASPAVAFLQNLITATVLIAFGLLITVMFLEITGVKVGEAKLFAAHPKFFGGIIIILIVAIFIGAGGLSIVGMPAIQISDAIIAFLIFIGVMIAAIWIMIQETKEKK